MTGLLRFLATLAILVSVLAGTADAEDVIHLKSGGQIKGWIVSESDDHVTIRLKIGGSMDVLRSLISEIARGPGEAAPADGKKAGAGGSFLVYEPGSKLVGWRQVQSYRRDDARLHALDVVPAV